MSVQDLRVGVIGVGMMGADHAERVVHRVAGARLVAVSDPDTARADQLAASFEGVEAGSGRVRCGVAMASLEPSALSAHRSPSSMRRRGLAGRLPWPFGA